MGPRSLGRPAESFLLRLDSRLDGRGDSGLSSSKRAPTRLGDVEIGPVRAGGVFLGEGRVSSDQTEPGEKQVVSGR